MHEHHHGGSRRGAFELNEQVDLFGPTGLEKMFRAPKKVPTAQILNRAANINVGLNLTGFWLLGAIFNVGRISSNLANTHSHFHP